MLAVVAAFSKALCLTNPQITQTTLRQLLATEHYATAGRPLAGFRCCQPPHREVKQNDERITSLPPKTTSHGNIQRPSEYPKPLTLSNAS